MLPGVERCEQCGFSYDEAAAAQAAQMIRDGAAGLAAILEAGHAGLRRRRQPGRWSPLEYACHVRDMLYVQRERLLAARRMNEPECTPMGRDERVELDGYAGQDPADVARQLADAALLLGNDLRRLSAADWDRQVIYTYPERARRSLRWLAIHTVHEVRHHLRDVREQITESAAITPAQREARWRLVLRFAIEATSEEQARAVVGQALHGLQPELRLRGEPVIRPRHRGSADTIWFGELHPDLTELREIDPDDAKTRCQYVEGHFPVGTCWSLPRNTARDAAADWPPKIWHRQPGDEVLLHPAVQAVMIHCTAADSMGQE